MAETERTDSDPENIQLLGKQRDDALLIISQLTKENAAYEKCKCTLEKELWSLQGIIAKSKETRILQNSLDEIDRLRSDLDDLKEDKIQNSSLRDTIDAFFRKDQQFIQCLKSQLTDANITPVEQSVITYSSDLIVPVEVTDKIILEAKVHAFEQSQTEWKSEKSKLQKVIGNLKSELEEYKVQSIELREEKDASVKPEILVKGGWFKGTSINASMVKISKDQTTPVPLLSVPTNVPATSAKNWWNVKSVVASVPIVPATIHSDTLQIICGSAIAPDLVLPESFDKERINVLESENLLLKNQILEYLLKLPTLPEKKEFEEAGTISRDLASVTDRTSLQILCDKKEIEVGELRVHIKLLDQANDNSKMQISNHESSLRVLNDKVESLISISEDQTNRINEKNTIIDFLKLDISTLQSNLQEQIQHDHGVVNLLNNESELSKQDSQINELKSKSDTELNDLKIESSIMLENLKIEHAKLVNQIEIEHADQILRLKADSTNLEPEVGLKVEYNQSESVNCSNTENSSQLESKIVELQNLLDEKSRSIYSMEIDKFESQKKCQDLNEKLSLALTYEQQYLDSAAKIADLEVQRKGLSAELENTSSESNLRDIQTQYNLKLQELESSINFLKESNLQLSISIEGLLAQQCETNSINAALRCDISEKDNLVVTLKDSNHHDNVKSQSLIETARDNSVKQMNDFKIEILSKSAEISIANKKIETQKGEIDNFVNQMNLNRGTADFLAKGMQEQVAQLIATKAASEKKIKFEMEEKFRKEKVELDSNIKKEKADSEDKSRKAMIDTELRNTKDKIESEDRFKKEKAKLNLDNEKLRKDLDALKIDSKKSNASVMDENIKSQSRIKALETDLSSSKHEHAKISDSLNLRVDEVNHALAESKNQNTQYALKKDESILLQEKFDLLVQENEVAKTSNQRNLKILSEKEELFKKIKISKDEALSSELNIKKLLTKSEKDREELALELISLKATTENQKLTFALAEKHAHSSRESIASKIGDLEAEKNALINTHEIALRKLSELDHENSITGKKAAQMVKDLQKQLAKERKGGAEDLDGIIKDKNQHTSETTAEIAQENEALIKRAQYFQDEYKRISEELDQKSKIVQMYVLRAHEHALQPDEKPKPIKMSMNILSSSIGLQKLDPIILSSINTKMQKLLEDLTVKTMQMEEEITRLRVKA